MPCPLYLCSQLLTFRISDLSRSVRVTVTASPALAMRQGVLFRRMVATDVGMNCPSSQGPTMTGSSSLNTPLVKIPPNTRPTSGTLKISSTWNSDRCCWRSGGNWDGGMVLRKLLRRLRFSPVTHDTVKIGAILQLCDFEI